jgi:hypothetical protein
MQPTPENGGDGTLIITGTEQADTLSILLNQADPTKIDVTLNGILTTYNLADFTKISITMLGGRGTWRASTRRFCFRQPSSAAAGAMS